MINATIPRGIRNKNPGNIKHSRSVWVGQSPTQEDSAFVQFTEPVYGLRALMKLLVNYQRNQGLDTVAGIIGNWAPPGENDTAEYVNAVAKRLGVDPQAPIKVADQLDPLARDIAIRENGQPPSGYPPDWYDDHIYAAAKRLALGLEVG